MEIAKIILEYIKVSIWPFFLLLLMIIFYRPIKKKINDIIKLSIPGIVDLQLSEQIKQIKKTSEEINKGLLAENKNILPKKEVNEILIKKSLKPTISSLDSSFFIETLFINKKQALSDLKIELYRMITNIYKILYGKQSSGYNIYSLLYELKINELISDKYYNLIKQSYDIATKGISLKKINEEEMIKLFESLEPIWIFYSNFIENKLKKIK